MGQMDALRLAAKHNGSGLSEEAAVTSAVAASRQLGEAAEARQRHNTAAD